MLYETYESLPWFNAEYICFHKTIFDRGDHENIHTRVVGVALLLTALPPRTLTPHQLRRWSSVSVFQFDGVDVFTWNTRSQRETNGMLKIYNSSRISYNLC